jgi:YIF1
MMVYLLEVLLVRLGLYLIGAPAVMLDLVAYIGYKFVPLCVNMGGGFAVNITTAITTAYCISLFLRLYASILLQEHTTN